MPLLIEGVLRNRKFDLFADFASMQRDGFATDTRVIAVDDGECRQASYKYKYKYKYKYRDRNVV